MSNHERGFMPLVIANVKNGSPSPTYDDGSDVIIAACMEVHRYLGPGLLESAYSDCLCHELSLRGLRFERNSKLAIEYKGLTIERAYEMDFVIEGRIILEIKAVERLLPIHEAQVITYLKLSGLSTALLVNFHASTVRNGLRRLTRKKD